MLDMANSTAPPQVVAQHVIQVGSEQKQQVIRFVRAFDANGQNIAATASWDMTVKFWNLDAPNPQPLKEIPKETLQERVYAFDVVYPRMVVGTADNKIHVFDLNSFMKIEEVVSPLNHQMRTIAIFPDALGYAIGSVEGRVGIQYFNEKSKNFAFRCHREQPTQQRQEESKVFPVNCISFNKKYNTFCTVGSDGIYNFW